MYMGVAQYHGQAPVAVAAYILRHSLQMVTHKCCRWSDLHSLQGTVHGLMHFSVTSSTECTI